MEGHVRAMFGYLGSICESPFVAGLRSILVASLAGPIELSPIPSMVIGLVTSSY